MTNYELRITKLKLTVLTLVIIPAAYLLVPSTVKSEQ